jgi:hypothetical protein
LLIVEDDGGFLGMENRGAISPYLAPRVSITAGFFAEKPAKREPATPSQGSAGESRLRNRRAMDRAALAAYDAVATYAKDWEGQPAPVDLHDLVKRFFGPGTYRGCRLQQRPRCSLACRERRFCSTRNLSPHRREEKSIASWRAVSPREGTNCPF